MCRDPFLGGSWRPFKRVEYKTKTKVCHFGDPKSLCIPPESALREVQGMELKGMELQRMELQG